MYSLHLRCLPSQVDQIAADLNDHGTTGVREVETDEGTILIAGFEQNSQRANLLNVFGAFFPEWHQEAGTDWIQYVKDRWVPREIGSRLFLLPHWSLAEVPAGRLPLRHNPGLACGTGEHPCTQLALEAIETYCRAGSRALDVGTGSGILALAAVLLGAGLAVGVDTDAAALPCARENFALNDAVPALVAGSVDCLIPSSFDVTVANISSTVLLSLLDDLVRVTASNGWLILTGFMEDEAQFFLKLFGNTKMTELNGWACVAVSPSSYAVIAVSS